MSEHSDINVRAVLGFGGVLIVVAAAVHLLVWLLFVYLSAGSATGSPRYPLAAGQADRLPPEPRLQVTPRDDLRELRTRQQQQLNSYGWVNRDAGVAHVPIDEAIRLTLEKGLPARPAGEVRK